MIIQIRYANNRIDVFDTSALAKTSPLGKATMLANFEIRVDEIAETGLWLTAHYYDTSNSGSSPKFDETPVAKRRRGWRFLLAEASEVPSIQSVFVNNDMVTLRIAGVLIDMLAFAQACKTWLPLKEDVDIVTHAIELYDHLCEIHKNQKKTGDEIAALCGLCNKKVISELREMKKEGSRQERLIAEEEFEE